MDDPWTVTPNERAKHEEQFKTLGATNGYITGEQAKGFFMQSRLPPQILGVIWMLSDMDGDGKMNLHEFSVACKLINLKIRGFNLPKALPPNLKQTACASPGSVPTTPADTAVEDTTDSSTSGMAAVPPVMPVQPMTAMIPQQPAVAPMVAPVAPVAPLLNQQTAAVAPQQVGQPMAPIAPMTSMQPMAAVQPVMGQPVATVHPGMPQAGMVPAVAPATAVPPSTVTPPGSVTGTPPLQKTPSLEGEWGVPNPSKLKYTQVFNTIDRTKTGFISAVQARNILIQSQLPQQILAQIWALSDVDNDGRLSSEEFVLALYLCEQAKLGAKVPTVLPPELIPPTQRRRRTLSVTSIGSAGTPGAESGVDFEGKRRENFEKGQAELERRRKNLLDAQRRETEERMRREREEENRKEKARQEAERRRQEELEKEMQRQQEVEAQKEADRKRQEELKEQARKDAEQQRQQEWEKQRLQELMNVRQRQQENLLALKAKNQSLTIELNTKDDRVKEVTQKISETRSGVTEIKATIDNMRSTRDTYMSDMNQLKAQARDQNQRLIALNQEKARLKARSLASGGAAGGENAAIDASIANKKVAIEGLNEKVSELKDEVSTKEEDVNNNTMNLDELKESVRLTAERCKELYTEFSEKREKVLELREKLINPDAAWGDTAGSAWADETPAAVPVETDTYQTSTCPRYRALYEFEARNADELSFLPGDIITVTSADVGEPGWLAGELNGQTGWFPEAYCEQYLDEVVPVAAAEPVAVESAAVDPSTRTIGDAVALYPWDATQINQLTLTKGDRITVREQNDQWLYGEVCGKGGWFPSSYVRMVSGPSAVSPPPAGTPQDIPEPSPLPDNLVYDDISQYYESIYPYASEEPGDLVFDAGELVLVVRKDGDWWHGIIQERMGVFPSNYVQLCSVQFITSAADTTAAAPLDEQVEQQTADVQEAEPVQEFAAQESVEQIDFITSAADATAAAPVEQVEQQTAVVQEAEPVQESADQGDRGKKPEIAMVVAPYEATAANQLSLARNQLVMIRKKTASGWWEGQLHAKGKKKQVGWFPASYVKICSGSNRSTPVSMEMTERMGSPSDVVIPQANPAAIKAAVQELKDAVSKTEAQKNSVLEKVQALYPYTAQNDDELTFVAGDVIEVLDKEDAAWWKGAVRGMEGVFPSNYVEPLGAGTPDDSLC